MSNEDFGYMIEQEKQKSYFFFKKQLKIIIVLISISSFALITISAYYFTRSSKSEEVPIVKAPAFEIKTRDHDSNARIKNIDKTIYENISNNKSDEFNDKINIVKTPDAVEVQESDHKQIPIDEIEESVRDDEVSIGKASVDKAPISNNKMVEKPNINNKNVLSGDKKPETGVTIKSKNEANITAENEKIQKPYTRVQLVALKSDALAQQYWLKLKQDHPNLFDELKYFVQKADLGSRGTFYRLQVGNFRNQIRAEEFCEKLIAKTHKGKSDCIIVE